MGARVGVTEENRVEPFSRLDRHWRHTYYCPHPRSTRHQVWLDALFPSDSKRPFGVSGVALFVPRDTDPHTAALAGVSWLVTRANVDLRLLSTLAGCRPTGR